MSSGFLTLPPMAGYQWRDAVANFAALPATGNTAGDVRVAIATSAIYVWSGSAWVAAGGGGGVAWGAITGTLSAQTDLQTALNAKAPKADPVFTGSSITTPGTIALTGASTTILNGGSVLGQININNGGDIGILSNGFTLTWGGGSTRYLAINNSTRRVDFWVQGDGLGDFGRFNDGSANNRFRDAFFSRAVSIGTTSPNANACLEAVSTTRGFLPPRMTTTQRTAMSLGSSDGGMIVFDTDLTALYLWNSTAWKAVTVS